MPDGSGGSVAGWPVGWFAPCKADGNNALDGANVIQRSGFVLPAPVHFTSIGVYLATPDGAHNYDFGIYTRAGALIANAGAQAMPNSGANVLTCVQGAQTLPPGMYVFAWTGTDTTLKMEQGTGQANFLYANSASASAGGALPATIEATVINLATAATYFWLQ